MIFFSKFSSIYNRPKKLSSEKMRNVLNRIFALKRFFVRFLVLEMSIIYSTVVTVN